MGRLRHREPNGRYARSERQKEFPPAAVMRLRQSALSEVRHAAWGDQIGRMFLQAQITAVEYSTARRWHAEAANHHHAIGCYAVKSAALEKGVNGHPPDPDSERGRAEAEKERRDRVRYESALRVLEASGCRSAVDRVVLQDEAPAGIEDMAQLKKGLSALAEHWGYVRKNGHAR
jgi:hypothetical protein